MSEGSRGIVDAGRGDGPGVGWALEGWPERGADGEVQQVAVDEIHDPGWRHPVEPVDPDFRALKASVRASGVLQPLLVRPRADGGYEVVSGVRRLAAARATALPTVPALLRDLTELEAVLGSWDALRRTPMAEPARAELHGRLLAAGMSAAEAETLIGTLTVVPAPPAPEPEAQPEPEAGAGAQAAPIAEAESIDEAAAVDDSRPLEEAAPIPVASAGLPAEEAAVPIEAAPVASEAPDAAAVEEGPDQLVLADLPEAPEPAPLEALAGEDVYDEILYDEDDYDGGAEPGSDEFDFEEECAVPAAEVASPPADDTVPAATAAVAPSPPAASSHGVLGRLARDPGTYATAGTFIAVWAIVFDLVILALGTTGNTRVLAAGAMMAIVGFVLAIASLAIPQPTEEAGRRR